MINSTNPPHSPNSSNSPNFVILPFSQTEIGKCQTILILLTGLCAFGGILENITLSIVVPYAKCELNISSTQQGLLTAVPFVGIFATIYFWGFMADTFGRQGLLRICTAGGFIFAFLSAFAVDVTLLILLRFITGAL